MNKILIASLIFGILLVGGFMIGGEDEVGFDICEEQPLFGLKYQNCNSIECINFYENIKAEVKEDCK